jgi:hypothetical protein
MSGTGINGFFRPLHHNTAMSFSTKVDIIRLS